MIIKNMKISNMGYIKYSDLRFESNKVNIIQGPNGSGKTTVLALLYSMFQNKEMLKYKSNQKEIASIDVLVQNQGTVYNIEKYYLEGNPKIVFNSFNEMKQLITMDFGRIFLFNGELIRDTYWLSDLKIKMAIELLSTLNIKRERIFDDYLDGNRKYHFVSQGEQAYLTILSVLATIPKESIFLCDEPFSRLDIRTAEKLYDVMEKLKGIQFILTSNSTFQLDRPFHKVDLILESRHERNVSFNFDYERFFYKDIKERLLKLDSNKKTEENNKPIIKYLLNEEVVEEEDRNVEHKEIKGNNPCESIVSTAEIYIIAFLNSWATGFGIIKWGISDDGRVKGVRLSKEDKDNIRKKLSERIAQVEPYLSQDLLHISFQEIIDDCGEIISDYYIIEILIEAVQNESLFSTSKGEVYIKTESGKVKLKPYGIQQEFKRRLKNS